VASKVHGKARVARWGPASHGEVIRRMRPGCLVPPSHPRPGRSGGGRRPSCPYAARRAARHEPFGACHPPRV